jgi:polysaccharide export outer membrane protein
MADGQVASLPSVHSLHPAATRLQSARHGTAVWTERRDCQLRVLAQGYRIGTGDRLTIRVLGQQDLTGDYIVDASGNISIPLVRSLPVAGLSTAEIETQITERLKQGFLRNPSVSVQLAIARPFYIMGQVNQAGSFSYRPGMTAQNAIAMAGGFSPRADQTSVLVTRRLVNGTKTQRVPVTTQLHPGDVVFVRERWF